MKKKRFLFMMLSMVMIMALISGCTAGVSDSAASPTPGTAATKTQTSTQTPTASASPTAPSETQPAPTEEKTYMGTTILLVGSSDADFTKQDPLYGYTYLVLFIDAANGNLTVVSLHAQTAVDAKDAKGNDAGEMPLTAVLTELGMDGVRNTLEARLGVPIDGALVASGRLVYQLLQALGPLEMDITEDMLEGNFFSSEMGIIKSIIGADESATVPEAGKQVLNALQAMVAAVFVPESVNAEDYALGVKLEEMQYRINREMMVNVLIPVLCLCDIDAVYRELIDNQDLYMTDMDDAAIKELLHDLQVCSAGDTELLQLPMGELSSRKEEGAGWPVILIEGDLVETEQEALQALLVR